MPSAWGGGLGPGHSGGVGEWGDLGGHLWLSYLFPDLPFQGCHHQTCKDRAVRAVTRKRGGGGVRALDCRFLGMWCV